MLFRFRYPWPLAHPQYFSSLVLRKWDKLRCLHLANGVMGYRHDTLGHALTTGTLKHLVTLQIAPDDCFDPSYLDSDEYRWRTPLLENLTIDAAGCQAEDAQEAQVFCQPAEPTAVVVGFLEGVSRGSHHGGRP